MLYAYDEETGTLTPCAETQFSQHGLLERNDLERWVEADPSMLGEDLMVVTTEYDGFDKTNERLDVLALDREGTLVVVELKRDDSGKNVDLQALKYAAYCSTLSLDEVAEIHAAYLRRKGRNATSESAKTALKGFISNDDFEDFSDRPRMMLVSRDFRPEVTASVQWLRKFDLDITCVKFDVYELPDRRVVMNTSVLIPLPETRDFEMRVQKKEVAEHSMSPIQVETWEFYSRCIGLLNERRPADYPPPRQKSLFYQVQTGVPHVHYEWLLSGKQRTRLGAEVHFEAASIQKSGELLQVCRPYLSQLEAALGGPVIVQEPWTSTTTRFYVERTGVEMNDELADWAVTSMATLVEVLQPVMDKIARKNSGEEVVLR